MRATSSAATTTPRYERALAADPNHAVTWSYYGMWQAEQGNLLKAKDDLEKVRLICGTDCKPYKMLNAPAPCSCLGRRILVRQPFYVLAKCGHCSLLGPLLWWPLTLTKLMIFWETLHEGNL
jgi:hypothetical protein